MFKKGMLFVIALFGLAAMTTGCADWLPFGNKADKKAEAKK